MISDSLFEQIKPTLIAGGYNLLLGSGVCNGSKNGRGESLRSSEDLRKKLCQLKAIPDTTTLQRAYSLLDDAERQREIVDHYSKCKPHASLLPLPNFIWRRLFTFNVDDVLENLFRAERSSAKQVLFPLNYDVPFEPTPDRKRLHAIHLHGWVGKRESGFVFSYAEYARVMSSSNAWMHLLAEILATESFIIAGTSLNEVDLEYYLSHRSDATPRRFSGPSLLIEPYPDAASKSDCARHGLTLVNATFGEFLAWLRQKLPAPPTLYDLVVPDVARLFPDKAIAPQLLRFFSDFKVVEAGDAPKSSAPSAFLYGRAPTLGDLNQHIDIQRSDNVPLLNETDTILRRTSGDGARFILVLDDAGTGKTTVISRIGHDLSRRGIPVLSIQTLSKIDPQAAIDCIRSASTVVVLVADGVADHAEQLREILQDERTSRKLVVLGAERAYRRDFVDLILGDVKRRTISLQPLTSSERRQLIELYRQYGLVGERDAVLNPAKYAKQLVNDPIAVAICRILGDFRPLQAVVRSLWEDSPKPSRLPYLCVALARHCLASGLRYSILQKIVGPRFPLVDLFGDAASLHLIENPDDGEYVIPVNAIIGDRVLQLAASSESGLMLDAFRGIADALAPHVNRRAYILRSPEARLSARLFDADKVVKPFLGNAAESFYVSSKKNWEWNSRYWEQRALLQAESDLETALRYAKHAVAVERHPFTLTTFGKLLFMKMEREPKTRAVAFDEAFENLASAIGSEEARSRIGIHPYASLFSGVTRFLELGGTLSQSSRWQIDSYIGEARHRFKSDLPLQAALTRLDALLDNS
jgi:hypothetical protein